MGKGRGINSLVITSSIRVPEKLKSSTNTVSHLQLTAHQKEMDPYMQLPAAAYKAEQISSTAQG